MKIKERIINSYKQFGSKIFLKRLIKRFFSPIVDVETYILAKANINLSKAVPKPKLKINVLLLKKDEIERMDILPHKKKLFYERLKSEDKICLTARYKGEIIYYCWISQKKMQVGNKKYEVELKNHEGFLFDAFCFPQWRGNRLHVYMSQQRLRYLYDHGKRIALVSYLKDNHVVAKIQESIGFIPEKEIRYILIFKLINLTLQKKYT